MAWFNQITAQISAIYDSLRPILDIVILVFLLYKGYRILKRTKSIPLIKGAGLIIVVCVIAIILNLTTLRQVLTIIIPGLLITVAIIFQPELRKIFMKLGQTEFFMPYHTDISQLDAVNTAMESLSRKKRGMLLVFPRNVNIKNIIDTGTKINAEISSTLILTIYEYDGLLHDGAMVIQNGIIAAAGCLLPLSERQDMRKNFGTRHRAALGMAEQSDAVVLVVSEETGAVSLAYDAKLYYDLPHQEVIRKLKELLDNENTGDK